MLSPAGLTQPLTCVLTDDDPVSRRMLENHITSTPGLNLLASLADGMQLLDFLHAQPTVDLLFLDVEMPLLSGLEVLRMLPVTPAVVLTTSHTKFAVEAFELRVTDYLVKPVEYPRFLQAISRVRRRQPAAAETAGLTAALPGPALEESLFVKSGSRLVRIVLAEIIYVEAVGSSTVVVTARQQLSTNQLLRDLAERLPPALFARIHRSYVVNRQHIEAVEDSLVTLTGGYQVPVGRTYLADFMASLRS